MKLKNLKNKLIEIIEYKNLVNTNIILESFQQ